MGGGVSRRADMPDSVNVLDGVADLLAELFLIELHLQQKQQGELSEIKTKDDTFCPSIGYPLRISRRIKQKVSDGFQQSLWENGDLGQGRINVSFF